MWLDYDKMVVVFGGCVSKKAVQGLRERGVKVYLDADRGQYKYLWHICIIL